MAGGFSRRVASARPVPRGHEAHARRERASTPLGLTPTFHTAGILGDREDPSGIRTIAGLWWPIRRALCRPARRIPVGTIGRITGAIGVNKASARKPLRARRSQPENRMVSR